jgi:hypothetical protein
VSSTTLCAPYHTLYIPRKEGLSTLYQASQNYQNTYFFFVATHQAQHCASAPPHQDLHHCDMYQAYIILTSIVMMTTHIIWNTHILFCPIIYDALCPWLCLIVLSPDKVIIHETTLNQVFMDNLMILNITAFLHTLEWQYIVSSFGREACSTAVSKNAHTPLKLASTSPDRYIHDRSAIFI